MSFNPNQPVHLFGVALIGLTAENGIKLLLTLGWIAAMSAAKRVLRFAAQAAPKTFAFWTGQGVSIVTGLLTVIGVVSIWFNDPKQLATAVALVTAGIAFALQRVITAFAGYLVILRGRTFNIGDRIVMGGVRGDVIALSFMQTTILEMGETPAESKDGPSAWIRSRQYTGRIVTVSNAKVFDEPVYNFTRELPYFFEEMTIGVGYDDDWRQAESILLEAAGRHTCDVREMSKHDRDLLERSYDLKELEVAPRVYMRLTDNWISLTVRFLTTDHGTRKRKDAMSREILAGLKAAGIEIASGTYAVVDMPRLQVSLEPPPPPPPPPPRPASSAG